MQALQPSYKRALFLDLPLGLSWSIDPRRDDSCGMTRAALTLVRACGSRAMLRFIQMGVSLVHEIIRAGIELMPEGGTGAILGAPWPRR
jgi:hypothetical protein